MKLLSSEPMQKVRIICRRDVRDRLVSGLHSLGLIDLRKSELEMQDDEPSADYTKLSEALIRVDGALDILGPGKPNIRRQRIGGSALEQSQKAKEIDRIYALKEELQTLAEDDRSIDYAGRVADCFMGTGMNLGAFASGILSFKAVTTDDGEFRKFKEHSKGLRKNSEFLFNTRGKNKNLVFVAYKNGDEKVEEALKQLKGTELDLHAKYLAGSPEEVAKFVSRKRSESAARSTAIKAELEKIGTASHARLSALGEALEIELARAEVSSEFKRTESTFMVEGWIPKKRMAHLRSFLHKATGNRFVLEELKTSELAPTLVNRPAFLKPFDYLMDFFSVPRSDEIDPTWIFIISFPVFYGLMVSDVGYGVASFLLSQLIIMKTDPDGLMSNTAKIWRMSAIPAIIVGIITNQWFGFPLNNLFGNFAGVSWFGSITWIIALTIIFGIVQVSLGFLFGFINEMRHGHRKLAVSKISSILVLLFGTMAVAGIFFHVIGSALALYFAIAAIASGVITLALSGTEAAEIMNLITHPLSYARIMGFGLSSIIIAMLIDKAFTPHLGPGVGGILTFVLFGIIFIVLHVMNMILSIFEGIVQAARLNFVEFFSKFYKGGGTKYRPFSYKRVYAEE